MAWTPRVVELDGIRFAERSPGGYFVAPPRRGPRYLHRYVWSKHNGPIPTGCVVHHRDHDPANNDISNLELVRASEHQRYHLLKRRAETPEFFDRALAAAREAAKDWHRSDAGREWHREHARRVAAAQVRVKMACTWCDGVFFGIPGARKRGFCSPSCQGMARKASGVDNVTASCTHCGAAFTTNRYTPRKTCSAACSRAAIGAAQRLRYSRG